MPWEVFMEIEEICGIVWYKLAHSDTSLSALMIAEEESLNKGEVVRALAKLNQAGLLWRKQEESFTYYRIKTELNALEWAQAVEVGVELVDLESFARLKAGQNVEDVLNIATSGEVEKNRERQIERKKVAHQKWLEGRKASRAAETDLARLVSDVRSAATQINSHLPEDDEVKKALKIAQEEAERALLALQASMR